jgi:glycosyltransferase involved in cell wall biosynthesis
LHHSVALFFPSFYEGFGIPLVEAMAAGTLVVASDIPALREVGCDVALYVDPREPCSMADALERCLALEDERTDRIAAGRQLASKYVWPACVGRLRSALEQ